jgi:hypothetical protein
VWLTKQKQQSELRYRKFAIRIISTPTHFHWADCGIEPLLPDLIQCSILQNGGCEEIDDIILEDGPSLSEFAFYMDSL